MLSQTSSSSQSRSRLQQGPSAGHRAGQIAPARSALRRTDRRGLLKPAGERCGAGQVRASRSSGWMFSQWRLLRSVRSRIPSFPHQRAQSYQHKMWYARNRVHASPSRFLKPVLEELAWLPSTRSQPVSREIRKSPRSFVSRETIGIVGARGERSTQERLLWSSLDLHRTA